ncbi:MAG: DoxX family protein [Chitinophagaceae bacterium]|nr:DoxX family protein [Chitinophagaceae bacterium]
MFSTRLNETATSLGLLLLRILSGGMMMIHGWGKIVKWAELKSSFPDPFGIGHEISLALTVFAEFICAGLLVVGLGTRLVLIPLLIVMAVAFFKIHAADPLNEKELALFYLVIYAALLLSGPGKFSLDKVWLKK